MLFDRLGRTASSGSTHAHDGLESVVDPPLQACAKLQVVQVRKAREREFDGKTNRFTISDAGSFTLFVSLFVKRIAPKMQPTTVIAYSVQGVLYTLGRSKLGGRNMARHHSRT